MIKCKECPSCGCEEFSCADELGEGFRFCASCDQEWWVDINYNKYSSPVYYEIFINGCRVCPNKDRNGDANYFDKRALKTRVRRIVKKGHTVSAFVTRPNRKRKMIYTNWPVNAVDLIGINMSVRKRKQIKEEIN